MTKKPNSMHYLDDAIRRISGRTLQDFIRTRTIPANAIVASMLPDGVIKGGSAIKMRYGDAVTRFTTDLDTATASNPELYIERLSRSLRAGWEGFGGSAVARNPASPKDIPKDYVMHPYDVKLTYLGKAWCTVPLEVGHNEIDDIENAEWVELSDAAKLFEELGFPVPRRVPIISLEHQVAQKLHAVSAGGDRARDLIDLQLIVKRSPLDLAAVKTVCERLSLTGKRKGSHQKLPLYQDGPNYTQYSLMVYPCFLP